MALSDADLDAAWTKARSKNGPQWVPYFEALRAVAALVRKQDEALIRQMHDALCECAEDSQEQLDRMEAAKLRLYKPQAVAFQEATIDAAKRAITAARARLGEKT